MSKVNANAKPTVGFKKPLALNNGRRALGTSSRQNQINSRGDNREATEPNNIKEAVVNASKTVVNDENAEAVIAAKANAGKSKIPKKSVSSANLKCRPKANNFVVTDMLKQSNQDVEMTSFSSFATQIVPKNVEDIDANDSNNVFLTPDYVKEIYWYLRNLEELQNIRPDFLTIQREMTPRMRSVLVDWLINVHHQFKLLPETLYLGIAIMDRFFQKEVISKDKIQLVGVTAFFIASKFEEIYPPDIKDFVLICDKLYHKRDIIKMELAILKSLQFELGRPLPLHFLRRNSKAAHADSKIHTLAKYLMELTLVEYECAHWKPSYLAAVALFVTLKVLSEDQSSVKWSPTLQFYSNYSEKQLISGASHLCKIIIKSEKSKFQNCRKKYSSPKLMEISSIPQLKSETVQLLASECS